MTSLTEEDSAILDVAQERYSENRSFLRNLKKRRNLDDAFRRLHNSNFAKRDCLTCANCCKTTSPIFYNRDIDRLARHLRMRPIAFMEEYLQQDEEGDHVLKSSPCPFLGADNMCDVYAHRPTACREYPHTDRKRMQQILDLTAKNTLICPAVAEIVEGLKEEFKN